MVAKSFPRKRVSTKNFHQTFFGQKFLWSQNHFLENGSVTKIFIKKFWSNIFLWSQNHFLEIGSVPKIFIKNLLVENFLWSHNHFLENGSRSKIFTKMFWSKIFLVAKSFPRKRVPPKIFIKTFGSKIFYGCKIISSKTGPYQKFSSKIFWSKIVLWSQKHFLENGSIPKIFIKNFFEENFFMVAKSFPRKRVTTNNFHQQFCIREFFYGRKIISSKTGPYQKFS